VQRGCDLLILKRQDQKIAACGSSDRGERVYSRLGRVSARLAGGAPFFQVTRRQGGTLSGRYRSNGYVLNQVSVSIYFPIFRDEPKKKPDLAKAFSRATALRSNKCKGRFDARTGLKGCARSLDHPAIIWRLTGQATCESLALAWFRPFSWKSPPRFMPSA
jgi:hypothetical protein